MPYKNKESQKEYIESLKKNDIEGWKRLCRKRTLKSVYGLTLEEYDRILDNQGGVCAICHQPPGSVPLCVDHDHSCCSGGRSCGKCVRGLICRDCNEMLGHADDNIDRIRMAIEYLNRARRITSAL